jgi:hypothetical protein
VGSLARRCIRSPTTVACGAPRRSTLVTCRSPPRLERTPRAFYFTTSHETPLAVPRRHPLCRPAPGSKTSACTGTRASSILRLKDRGRSLGLPGQDPGGIPGPDLWRFTRNGPSYSLQGINPIDQTAESDVREQQKADNDRRGQGKSSIERYEIQRGTLQEYWMNNGAAVEFLKAKHPTAKDIKRNVGKGEYVVIDTFDDEVFRVLAEIY